jgi:hypothetical protein
LNQVASGVYNREDNDILAALNDLLLMPVLLFETQPVLYAFISAATGKNFDLADLLIAHSAGASPKFTRQMNLVGAD